MTDTAPLMTATAAARYLKVGRTWFHGLVSAGKIRGVRPGRRRLFRRTDLDRYVASLKPVR